MQPLLIFKTYKAPQIHEANSSSLLSAFPIRGRQLFLSSVSSSVTSASAMSSFTTSINLRLAFPVSSFLAIPSSESLSQYTHYLSSVHVHTTSFLMVSIIVTSNENLNIFNSATSISASCLFVSATVSNPYNIAGLTATMYTFPFTLAGTRLSQITPDILLQPFHPACTLFFSYLPHSPLLCKF